MRKTRKVLVLLVIVALMFGFYGLGFSQEEKKININTATMEELVELKHIGENYAQRIIEFREKNGPFEKIDDIMKVKGIGEKIFEVNKDRIVAE